MNKEIPTDYQLHLRDLDGSDDRAAGSGISVRSILLGAVLAFLLNFFDAYATNLIRGAYLTLNFSTPAALFILFFVVLISGGVALLRRSLALTQAELVTIYIMLLVACCIPGMGFTQFIIPCLVGSTYYATPENNWDVLYNQYIPKWMIPQGENVALYFFEGLPPGEGIPWGAWVRPLSYWYGFFLALSLAMICLMVILRRQWVEREKLAYPLVQVPMEMLKQEEGRGIGADFFKSKVMWMGFAFSFLLLSVNALHLYFPSFPTITRTGSIDLLGGAAQLSFWFSPPWIGFFYFVNLGISASVWFFYLITTYQQGVFNFIGLQSAERMDIYSRNAYMAFQGMGSMIVFVLVGLWISRSQLKDVWHKVWGRTEVDDRGEMLSYRQAFSGLVAGLVMVWLGLWMSGLPPHLAAMFVFGAMVLYIGLTRVVAEGGIPAMRPPVMTSTFVISGAGATTLGPSGLVALGFTYGWHAEVRSFVMSSVANGLKMGEVFKGAKRRLFWAVVLAIVVSIVGSSYVTLQQAYKYGGINLNPLFFGGGAAMYGPRDMVPRIAGELRGASGEAWLFMGIGGAIMVLLMWMRQSFLWWPLHPLGYAISANWKTGHIFCSALVAWGLKLLILRFGGAKQYQNLKPFFLGLILGEIVAAGMWLVIDYITGHIGSFLTQV